MKTENFVPASVHKSPTQYLIRKNPQTPLGHVNENSHFRVDANTAEAIIRAVCIWATKGDDVRLMAELNCYKSNLELI